MRSNQENKDSKLPDEQHTFSFSPLLFLFHSLFPLYLQHQENFSPLFPLLPSLLFSVNTYLIFPATHHHGLIGGVAERTRLILSTAK